MIITDLPRIVVRKSLVVDSLDAGYLDLFPHRPNLGSAERLKPEAAMIGESKGRTAASERESTRPQPTAERS